MQWYQCPVQRWLSHHHYHLCHTGVTILTVLLGVAGHYHVTTLVVLYIIQFHPRYNFFFIILNIGRFGGVYGNIVKVIVSGVVINRLKSLYV